MPSLDESPGLEEDAMDAERWVSVDELAQHLGVARDTVYRWMKRKGLPAHRLGRLWKFKLPEVDAWVRGGGADDRRGNTRSPDSSAPSDS